MQTVTITNGSYRGEEVHNQTFEFVSDVKEGARGSTITVRPNDEIGTGRDKIRITVQAEDITYSFKAADGQSEVIKKVEETDAQIMKRIEDRFEILDEMTRASIEGHVRALIVTGPPGVGKSFGVEQTLEKASLFETIKGDIRKFEVVKGSMSSLGLYTKLYNFSNDNNVLVFDDCDIILYDDVSLNILKAALDTGKKRIIQWNSDSRYLKDEGIPNQFDFKGSVIFITNLQFEHIKSAKLQDHLKALQSRCHYLDLAMPSDRHLMLRIKQIHNTGELFRAYKFEGNEGDQIVEFMEENQHRLRELSLRTALKIADLFKVNSNWKRYAESTVMRLSF